MNQITDIIKWLSIPSPQKNLLWYLGNKRKSKRIKSIILFNLLLNTGPCGSDFMSLSLVQISPGLKILIDFKGTELQDREWDEKLSLSDFCFCQIFTFYICSSFVRTSPKETHYVRRALLCFTSHMLDFPKGVIGARSN